VRAYFPIGAFLFSHKSHKRILTNVFLIIFQFNVKNNLYRNYIHFLLIALLLIKYVLLRYLISTSERWDY
jgi:hypothetical protein